MVIYFLIGAMILLLMVLLTFIYYFERLEKREKKDRLGALEDTDDEDYEEDTYDDLQEAYIPKPLTKQQRINKAVSEYLEREQKTLVFSQHDMLAKAQRDHIAKLAVNLEKNLAALFDMMLNDAAEGQTEFRLYESLHVITPLPHESIHCLSHNDILCFCVLLTNEGISYSSKTVQKKPYNEEIRILTVHFNT